MMIEKIQKICLWIIYIGTALTLALPLYFDANAFFPFVAPRAFVFRGVVEIMLMAFLFLAATDEKYRPRLNFLNITLTLLVVSSFISSLLGVDFFRSFWGDMERSEGLLLWLHLWAYFLILTSVIRSERNWMRLLDFSLAAALLVSLFGLGQYFGFDFILQTSGSRVDGTFGNAAFFAGYMLFHIAFAAYLFFKRESYGLRIYYLALAVLFGFMVFASQTRGAVVGLAAGIFAAMALLAWANKANPQIRKYSIAVIVVLIAAAGVLYLSRDQQWVRDSRTLQRLATISLETRTAETRLATWGAGLEGFKERSILGYGMENFNVVFNENFPPVIFEDEGSVVWFDRAHNVIIDKLVATGIVGLLLYLAFIFYPLYYFIRYLIKQDETKIPAVIFSGLIVAFFIQNLFVFETVVTYVPLFFAWAFMAAVFLPEGKNALARVPQKAWTGAFVIALILTGPILWKINIAEAKINREMATAMTIERSEENFFGIVEQFKKVLESDSYALEEYRLNYIDFIGLQLTEVGEVADSVKPIIEYTDEQVKKQLDEFGYNTKNLLLVMRHYNFTRSSIAGEGVERLQKAVDIYPRLLESSPTRVHVPQEAGHTRFYLYREYKKQGDVVLQEQSFDQAISYYIQAIELNPKAADIYINPIMLYLEDGNSEGVREVLALAEQNRAGLGDSHWNRLLQFAKSRQQVEWVRFFSEKLIENNPDNVELLIDLALSFAYEGDREGAIELAEKIKTFGEDYRAQAEVFIEEINKGTYEQQARELENSQ